MGRELRYPCPPWLTWRTVAETPASWNAGRVAVLSSRLGRDPIRQTYWMAGLRQLIEQVQHAGQTLLTTPGTTAHGWLCHLQEFTGISLISLAAQDAGSRVPPWARRMDSSGFSSPMVVVSGPLDCREQEWFGLHADCSLGDRLLLGFADEVVVLHARPGGQVARMVELGLAAGRFKKQRLWIATHEQGVPQRLAEDWIARGAHPLPHHATIGAGHALPFPSCMPDQPLAVSRPDPVTAEVWHEKRTRPYLCHWTRAARGPMPGQSASAYWRALLAGEQPPARSARDSLAVILQTRRLMASPYLNRAAVPVVCFTAVPLTEFATRRCYRRHLGRWDFEHFGLAIDQQWLADRGARPVLYGSDATWESLGDQDRPFYQLGGTDASVKHDWTDEQEWRVVGDVQLAELAPQDGAIFVASHDDLQHLPTAAWLPYIVMRAEDCSRARSALKK